MQLTARSSLSRGHCAFWLLSLLPLQVQAGPEAMTALAERFYAIVLDRQDSGLPDANLQQSLAPLLGARLRELLAEAPRAEQRQIAATPAGDKPDIFEGDLLTGILEGGHEVQLAAPGGDTMTATVIHVDRRFAKGHRHRVAISMDQLVFAQEAGEWRIVDVRTGLDRAASGAAPGLVQVLGDYVRSAPRD